MQIREISLKELYEAYELVKKIYDISYEEFEDLIYEMRERYTMFGVFSGNTLLAYAGVDIVTTLKEGRHLRVYDIVATDDESMLQMRSYLEDYARISAARKVVYED